MELLRHVAELSDAMRKISRVRTSELAVDNFIKFSKRVYKQS